MKTLAAFCRLLARTDRTREAAAAALQFYDSLKMYFTYSHGNGTIIPNISDAPQCPECKKFHNPEKGCKYENCGGPAKSLANLHSMMGQASTKLEMPEGLTEADTDADIYANLDPDAVAAFNNAAVGKTAPNGVTVTKIEPHAFAQAARKNVSLSDFGGIFEDPVKEIHPKKTLANGTQTQKIYGTRAGIFIDVNSGAINTIFSEDR